MTDEDQSGLGSQRQAFDVPPEVAYFNTASLAPLLRSVRAAGESALRRRAQPWTIRDEEWFGPPELLRSLFARLVGGDADGVALVPATSYGLAVAANCLRLDAGQRILVLAEEYPSGIYTWRRQASRTGATILTARRAPGQTWTEAVLAALDERVGVVSVPNVHWTDGSLVDLDAVARRSHELGARLVIDGSQSVGAMPLSVAALRPDFLVCVGYKWLLGPFGRSYLWVAEEHRAGQPLEENWIVRVGAEDFAGLVEYQDDYQPGARRYDQGARTLFELTPMAVAGIEQLLAWKVERIAATLGKLTADIAARAAALGLPGQAATLRGPHLLGLSVPEGARARILPALADAGCYAALRGRSLRVAPHLHITPSDVDRLIDALARAL
jgi:selenocysteine lyase/cysteine desulfurase